MPPGLMPHSFITARVSDGETHNDRLSIPLDEFGFTGHLPSSRGNVTGKNGNKKGEKLPNQTPTIARRKVAMDSSMTVEPSVRRVGAVSSAVSMISANTPHVAQYLAEWERLDDQQARGRQASKRKRRGTKRRPASRSADCRHWCTCAPRAWAACLSSTIEEEWLAVSRRAQRSKQKRKKKPENTANVSESHRKGGIDRASCVQCTDHGR